MNKQIVSKLLLATSAIAMAIACQPKKPVEQAAPAVPAEAPIAPPQAYESEDCTDVDECSEGAAQESLAPQTPEQTADATPAEAETPQAEQPSVADTTPSHPEAHAAPEQPMSAHTEVKAPETSHSDTAPAAVEIPAEAM